MPGDRLTSGSDVPEAGSQQLAPQNWMPASAPGALQLEALSVAALDDDERRASGHMDRRRVASPGRRRTDPDPADFALFSRVSLIS